MTNFPVMRAHAGVWEGTYRHLDADGALLDQHTSRVECLFPDEDDIFYRQLIRFEWADGRMRDDVFDGRAQGKRILFDTATFRGESWETEEDIILLRLDRKDEPGASFKEVILLAPGGQRRARTWHWFRDGALYRRTLCDETRTST